MQQWSHTRDEIFRDCARKYYYRYYGGAGGWSLRAPEMTRRIYRLTQLTSFDQALGIAIHARAREIAAAVLQGAPLPSLALLEERTRAELNRLYLGSKDLTAFRRDPGAHPVLLSVYYGRGVAERTLQRIRVKMKACLVHLLESPIWVALGRCHPASVWLTDAPGAFIFEEISIWATPDLVFAGTDGCPTIVDWKTGRVVGEKALAQLGIYARFVKDSLAQPLPARGFIGKVADLQHGETWEFALTELEIAAADHRIRESVKAMDALLLDPKQGLPRPITSFPLAARPARCPECNYWELCEPQIRSSSATSPLADPIQDARASS
ncbi:MAG TPA: PD-(D/E)XK nuclease family protein [Longimicrobiaceae bacterium]|jgi:hypothetical protein